jgi:biotin-dependent carboxylase-like uncharacterized protein
MAEGFPVCGAADTDSMEIANMLVGNSVGAAVLEITLGGFAAQICCDSVVAITGADAPFMINGVAADRYRAYAMKSGDYVYIGYATAGCRIYMSVGGGIDVPTVMGSRSTFLKTGMGGYEGRKLKAGDMVPIGIGKPVHNIEARCVEPMEIKKNVTLRALAGPQDDMFESAELDKFFSSEYTVTPASDRMGLRLDGPALKAVNGTDIISDGIACGSVQIPRDGKPIILGADRQTTGGYAKPATVLSADMSIAGQLTPGCKVSFKRITAEEAEKAVRDRAASMKRLSKRLKVKYE